MDEFIRLGGSNVPQEMFDRVAAILRILNEDDDPLVRSNVFRSVILSVVMNQADPLEALMYFTKSVFDEIPASLEERAAFMAKMN